MTPAGLNLAMVLGVAAIAAGWAWLLLRAARRCDRRADRAVATALLFRLHEVLDTGRGAIRLRGMCRLAPAPVFWSALEALSLKLDRPGQRALGRALDALGHVRRERRMLREETPWRAELAARRLGILHGPRNRRALHHGLRRGPRPVTMASARALARWHDGRALRWLLENPERLDRGRRALTALFRAFGRRSCPILARHLESHARDAAIEAALLSVLGTFRYRPAREIVARRLGAAHLDVRIAAVRALGLLSSPHHAAELMALLRDPAWQVRAQAARALGLLGSLEALEDLAASTRDREWWVRRHAAYALDQLGDAGRAALTAIRDHSSDPYAREMADEVLRGGFLRRSG